jgi:Uncharacterized protein conserved in bacteria
MTLLPRWRTGLLAALFTLAVPAVLAQAYPARPLKLVVPFAAGGATDAIARFVADRISRDLGQPVVVDNRAGANGAIGSELVARSEPDGYTLLAVTAGTHAINKSLYKDLKYDPVKDFTHIGFIATAPNVLVINKSLPVSSVNELIDYARKNPGKLSFGSAGTGSTLHLAGELFKTMASVDIVHIPYKGGSAAQVDLLSGNIQLMFDSLSTALPHIKSGRVRALGVTGETASAALPGVPTVSDAGLGGYSATAWFGIVGPANMPASVTRRLNQSINKALETEEARRQFETFGADPSPKTPERFRDHVVAEVAKWAKVVEASGAKPN